MKKLQIDRSYLETVLQNTLDEVNDHGTIDTLRASVREYQEEKQGMQDAIKRCTCARHHDTMIQSVLIGHK